MDGSTEGVAVVLSSRLSLGLVSYLQSGGGHNSADHRMEITSNGSRGHHFGSYHLCGYHFGGHYFVGHYFGGGVIAYGGFVGYRFHDDRGRR